MQPKRLPDAELVKWEWNDVQNIWLNPLAATYGHYSHHEQTAEELDWIDHITPNLPNFIVSSSISS